MLAALANPIRLRILAQLADGRDYVSHLAREIGVSRPLLHMHLQRLETVGLVVGSLELSEDGKALKFYEVSHFDVHLTAATVACCRQDSDHHGPVRGPVLRSTRDVPDGGTAVVQLARRPGRDSPGADGHGRGRLRGRGFVQLRTTKIKAGQEDDLRQLVRRYEHLAESSFDAQQRAATDLSEMRSRTVSIEQILRTVE